MMIGFRYVVSQLFFGFIAVLLLPCSSFAQTKIIFDTDMGPDYDDVGALTVLHALSSKGECEILATVASDGHPDIAPTIKVINAYFGKPDIPIGIPTEHAPNFTANNNWNDSLITRFEGLIKSGIDYPRSVDIYRKVLASQPDQSVTIVTVGFTSNLYDLIKSEPDDFSSLNGMGLVKKKVKEWVAMAGGFPTGKEFNVEKDSMASYEVFKQWPTRILFSGFEIGVRIRTGVEVATMSESLNSPIQWAYAYNLRTYGGKVSDNRASWDQTAVLCAVRDPEDYFYVNGPGKFIAYPDGSNSWDPDTNAQHYFLSHKYPFQKIADILEELMMHVP